MTHNNENTFAQSCLICRDPASFGLVVEEYQAAIRRFFMNLTGGDVFLSDDLAQDTFVKAYTHVETFKGLSSVSTWLYRIAYNVFYDYKRSKKNIPGVELSTIANRMETGEASVGEHLDIYGALHLLTEAERTCVTLQLMEGLPIDQIAQITGMADGTVKSHLSRGKNKLANYLRQNGYERRKK